MAILKDKYEGKTLGGSRIVKILDIVSMGKSSIPLVSISVTHDDASGEFDVEFEAEAIVFEPGEIINGCTVAPTRERRGIIHLEHEHATIAVKGDTGTEMAALKPNQMISCKVEKADCNFLGDKINVLASLNLKYDSPIIQASSDFNPTKNTDFAGVEKMIAHIKSLNDLDAGTIKRRRFFTKFLTPSARSDLKVKSQPVKLLNNKYTIEKNKYYREVLGDSDEPQIEEVEVSDESIVFGQMTGANMVYKFLTAYYNSTFTIKSMIEIYPEEDDEANSNLWDLYR
jgi:hypothetical protein